MTPQSAKKAKYKSLESLPYGGCPKGRFFYFRGAAAPFKTALPNADHSAPQARPNLFMRPKAALFTPSKRGAFGPTISFYAAKGRASFLPKGKCSQPPILFIPHCAGRSGVPFYLIDSGRPTQGLPASNAALAARRRSAVAASPQRKENGPPGGPRENAPGAPRITARLEAKMGPWTPNRGISAEMQCGTASRAARDLTGEPCSPVNPFFLDGGFWLGESASRELSGGVGGAFWLPEEQKASKPPTIFLWYRQAAPSLFLKKRWWGRKHPSWRG